MSRIAPQGELRQRQPREKDRKYLDSFRDTPCESCTTNDGTTVGAHIRIGEDAGIGAKPDDALTVALCAGCHFIFDHGTLEARLKILANVLKGFLRQRYRAWRETRR